MASLYCSSARPTQSILGFHNLGARPDSFSIKFPPNLLSTPLDFRFKKASRLSISQRQRPLNASTKPSEGSMPEKPEETKTDTASTAQGPPFLTILAGLLVIFVVFWIIKSIVLWLLSFIFVFP